MKATTADTTQIPVSSLGFDVREDLTTMGLQVERWLGVSTSISQDYTV